MHPKIGYYQMNQDHMADLRHQAQRCALARAARRARRARPHRPGPPGPNPAGIVRRVLTTRT